jgi:hypothetical protein
VARRVQATSVMQMHIAKEPIEVPEDVRAEDARLAERRRMPPPDAVPEDTRSELDRETRLADAELQLELTEGRPPAADDADLAEP